MSAQVRVTLLAGGVGGARMAESFAACDDVDLTIIGNVADDEEFHGLWVSPDIDTLTYTLSDRINREQGWGVKDEGRRALDTLATLGADTWMFLGDRDFGLHIYRTARLRAGDTPSEIAHDVAVRFGVRPKILLPTDDRVQTRVRTDEGWLTFQEYFVRAQCAPEVKGLRYDGIETAKPCRAALEAILAADLIVVAPSNPLVSVAPILGVVGIRESILRADAPVVAVSPLIDGKVVKGPADRMLSALGYRADALGIAEIYSGLIDALFIAREDAGLSEDIRATGAAPVEAEILIPITGDKSGLARDILNFYSAGQNGAAA